MARSWKKLLPGLVLLGLVGPGCYHVQEIDITTGRFRDTRALLNLLPVSRRVEDSFVTNLLPAGALWDVKPDWQRVNTFAPGAGNSPYHRFHGAYNVVAMLKDEMERAAAEGVRFTEPAKHRVGLNIVRLWQETNRPAAPLSYIGRVMSLAWERAQARAQEGQPSPPIIAADLPPLHPTTKPTKPKD